MRTKPTRSKDPELIRKIKSYVDEYNRRYLTMPSTQEIGNALGINKSTAYRYLVHMKENDMISYDGRKIGTHRISRKRNAIDVPISDCIPCGSMEEQEEVITDYLSVPKSLLGDGDFFAMKAAGDSMIDAGIDDGDIVIIKRALEANKGDIVAALVDDHESTLKLLAEDEETQSFRLQAQNHTYNWKYVPCKSFSIKGVAVNIMKQI